MKNILTLSLLSLIAMDTNAMGSLRSRRDPETLPANSSGPTSTPTSTPTAPTEPATPIVTPGGTQTASYEVSTSSEAIKVEVVPGQVEAKSDYAVMSSLSYMADVAAVANCVIYNPDFIKEVAAHKQFDYTTDSSKVIADKMAKFTPVVLSTYKKSFTKTIAYRNIGSNVLYFNTTMNPRRMRDMVNTAIHERLHVVGYGHGDNNSYGKENSVPYGIGTISEKYADRCNKTKTK